MSNDPVVSPAQKPAKKHKKWPWIAGAAVAIVLIAAIANASGGGTNKTGGGSPLAASTTSTTPTPTMDPVAAAASSSAAQASRDSAASSSAEVARQSSAAARRSSEAAVASEAQRQADEAAARKITYSVTTTGPGINSVTYMKPNFNISQVTTVKGKKWSTTIQAEGSTLGINMNAQNSGGGTITCKITRGTGEVVAENSSSGDYAVVSCG